MTETTQQLKATPPKAFLIDMDGTLYFQGKPCPGAIEAVDYLRQEKYQLRFLTNTTAKTPKMLHTQMQHLGFHIYEDEIFNATYACLLYLRSQSEARCHFMVDDAVKGFFKADPYRRRCPPMLRKAAMTCGRFPVLACEASTSRTQWLLFSMVQFPSEFEQVFCGGALGGW